MPRAERAGLGCTSPLWKVLLYLWISLWSLACGLRFSISDWKLRGQDLVILISSYPASGLLPKSLLLFRVGHGCWLQTLSMAVC